MKPGIILKHEADFDYAIHFMSTVEICIGDELAYTGILIGQTDDTVQVPDGSNYLKLTTEIRTI